MSDARGLQAIRAVTFDAAGTLLRPHPSVGAVYQEIAERHGCECDSRRVNESFRSAFVSVFKNSMLTDPEEREHDFWRRVAANTFAAAGARITNFEPLFAELWEAFAHADRWHLLPGVESALRTLRARGYRLAVISNWDRRLHTVLQETGLRGFFDAVIISSEAGHEKPEPGIFRAAEAALGMPAAQCLHVGDDRAHDFDGARSAGWQALLLRHNRGEFAAGEIAGIAQVAPLLEG